MCCIDDWFSTYLFMPTADANLIKKMIWYAAPLFVLISQVWAWLSFSLLCRITYSIYYDVYKLRICRQKNCTRDLLTDNFFLSVHSGTVPTTNCLIFYTTRRQHATANATRGISPPFHQQSTPFTSNSLEYRCVSLPQQEGIKWPFSICLVSV